MGTTPSTKSSHRKEAELLDSIRKSFAPSSRLLRTEATCGCTLVMADWVVLPHQFRQTSRDLKRSFIASTTQTCRQGLCLPAAPMAGGWRSSTPPNGPPALGSFTYGE